MRLTLEQACMAAEARPLRPFPNPEALLTGAATDNRQVKPGDLFVCIQGEQTDGHLFAAAAVEAGAAAILADHDPLEGGTASAPVLIADDTVRALGRLGHAWRKTFSGKVVGVTGTAGKTTAKEMLAQVLALRGPTAKNHLNLNTQVGLPVSMLSASGDEEFWVMEAGISHAQDMDELGPIMEPDLAIILNVGLGHTQGLGNKGTAYYKSRLLTYLAEGGRALVSADYPDLVKEARAVCPSAVYFSTTGKQLAYRASYLGLTGDSGDKGLYRLWLDGTPLDVECALVGPYGAENVIAVAAAAHMLGLSLEEISQGLENAVLPAQRFSRFHVEGWNVIDDSYNANPLSCARVLEAAQELARDKSLVCVMGEMRELGDVAEEEHVALGKALGSSRAEAVFWGGGHADAVLEGLKSAHYHGAWHVVANTDDFWPMFSAWEQSDKKKADGLILFKGSRGNQLERLVRAFRDHKA